MFISMGGISSHADNTDISKYKDVIYIESTEAEAGDQIILSVKMKNSIEVPGFQFDLYLPNGMSVAETNGMCDVNLSTARTTSVKTNFFDSAIQTDGALRVLCNTTKKNPTTGKLFCFSGNDGEVCTITVNVNKSIANGNYNIELRSIEISDVNSAPHKLEDVIVSTVSVGNKVVFYGDDWMTDITSVNIGRFQSGYELYQERNYKEGDKVLYQSITVPEDGIYEIQFYAVTSCTSERYVGSKYGDDIAVAYATTGDSEFRLPMTVKNQTGCTLVEAGNIRTLSIEASQYQTIEFGLKNIAEGGNWYTIQGISIKKKTVAELFQSTYDEAKTILDNSKESVTGAKAEFEPYVTAMATAMTGTLKEAQTAADNLAKALSIFRTKSFPIKGTGIKYDMTDRMYTGISDWICEQGNGPVQYGFTGTTETYSESICVAGRTMYQTITGLPIGEYEVHFYGVANSAHGVSNAEGIGFTVAYANEETLDIAVVKQDNCMPSDYERVITCFVKDGKLEYGLKNIADQCGNWYICKAVALYMIGGPDLQDYYDGISIMVSNAERLKEKSMEESVLSKIEAAINNAEGYSSISSTSELEAISNSLSETIDEAEMSIKFYEKVRNALLETESKVSALDTDGQAAYNISYVQEAYDHGYLQDMDKNDDVMYRITTAYSKAVKAQTSDNSDMTGAIVNPRPESETMNTNGWNISMPQGGNAPFIYGPFFEFWNPFDYASFDYYQTLDGIPNGEYIISAKTFTDQLLEGRTSIDSSIGVYGRSGTFERRGYSTLISEEEVVTTDTVLVVNGMITIGVKNFTTRTTQWFHADDFKLTLIHKYTDEELETVLDSVFGPNCISLSGEGNIDMTKFTLDVSMDNCLEIVAAQMDINIPNGMSWTSSDIETTSRIDNFAWSVTKITDTKYRVELNSKNNQPITGKTGKLFSLSFDCDDTKLEGKSILVNNIVLSDKQSIDLCTEPIAECSITFKKDILGDVNNDGKLSIADIVGIIRIINGDTTGLNIDAADYDQNGIIEKADADRLADDLTK